MNELISVIVPIYKVEPYLRRCVDSILKQSYKDLEIILVDDGSPDQCGDICDEYDALDRRVKVIHQQNRGLSEARNVGIDNSHGAYLSFIDSDDWIHKEYFEMLHKLIGEEGADISVCNFKITSSKGNADSDETVEHIHVFTSIQAQEQLSGKLYLQMVTAWGKLYRREIFSYIRFPSGKFHEDEFIAHRVLDAADKVVYTSKKLLYYWQREDSFTALPFIFKIKLDLAEALQERAELYDRLGLNDLRDKTCKKLFGLYLEISRKVDGSVEPELYKQFRKDFRNLRERLRAGNQTVEFRAFYELYYIFPRIMDLAQKINRKLHKK